MQEEILHIFGWRNTSVVKKTVNAFSLCAVTALPG